MKLKLITIGLLLGASPVWAQDVVRKDVLLIERVENTATVTKPAKGISMTAVEAQYGQPVEKNPSVGDPPISRWVYPQFTVYFEYQHVIHSVVNRASEFEDGPESING